MFCGLAVLNLSGLSTQVHTSYPLSDLFYGHSPARLGASFRLFVLRRGGVVAVDIQVLDQTWD